MRVQRVAEPQSSVAPSCLSGTSVVAVISAVGGSTVADGKNPMGVSVPVAVADGRGVMLGNAVVVMEGSGLGGGKVTVESAVGNPGLLSLVGLAIGAGATGVERGTGSVTIQADAANTMIKAIKSGRYAFSIS